MKMKNKIYILGIDPGLDGVVTLLSSSGKPLLMVEGFKINVGKGKTKSGNRRVRNVHDLYRMDTLLKHIMKKVGCGNIRALLEHQSTRPRQAAQSVFKTGYGFGAWEMCLVSNKISYQLVHPISWQKKMFKGYMGNGDTKKTSILVAKKLFPTVKFKRAKDHNKSDSLLIAEYYRREIVGG